MKSKTDELQAVEVIMKIAQVSHAISVQAGVGGMETAGSIISFLAINPERVPAFLSGDESPVDWPIGWHAHGCLNWHGQDGKIHGPSDVGRVAQ